MIVSSAALALDGCSVD